MTTEKQFSSFYLGDTHFGIDILLVKEVNRHLDITPVAGAPDFVAGLLNLRGQIVTVVDLGVRLGMEPRPMGKSSRCIVLKTSAELARLQHAGLLDEDTGNDLVGLLVDRIGDMITVAGDRIDQPPANIDSINRKYLSGVLQMAEGLTMILRVREVLASGR